MSDIEDQVDELVERGLTDLAGEDQGWDRWAAAWLAGDRDKLAELKATFACCTGFQQGVTSIVGKDDVRARRANARASVLYAALCLVAKKSSDLRDALAMAAGAFAALKSDDGRGRSQKRRAK